MKFFNYIKPWLLISVCLVFQSVLAQQQLNITGTMKLAPGSKIGIFGDVSNNGTLIDSSEAFILAGDSSQTILGDSITKLINFRVNNHSTAGVTINQDLLVSGTFTLSDGPIHTSKSAMLTLSDGAAVVGGDTTSYVEGPLNKLGNSAFTFPVGKEGLYAPVTISAPANKTDQFTCEYFNADANGSYDVGSKDPGIGRISSCEYWVLDRTIGSSAVQVTLNWGDRGCSSVVPEDALVIRWDGSHWKNHGNGGTTGTMSSGTVVSNESISSFSPFAIASTSSALPIGLLRFEDNCINGIHTVEWATATETSNDYFTIETSFNGKTWSAIAEVNGQGNSSTEVSYSYRIPKGVTAGDYLRLKQTDFDGQFTVSAPISATPCLEKSPTLSVYPNPTKDVLNVKLSTGFEENITYIVYSLTGTVVSQGVLRNGTINLSAIPSGSYLCQFETPAKTFFKKVAIVD